MGALSPLNSENTSPNASIPPYGGSLPQGSHEIGGLLHPENWYLLG
jgi:hypothetical protein